MLHVQPASVGDGEQPTARGSRAVEFAGEAERVVEGLGVASFDEGAEVRDVRARRDHDVVRVLGHGVEHRDRVVGEGDAVDGEEPRSVLRHPGREASAEGGFGELHGEPGEGGAHGFTVAVVVAGLPRGVVGLRASQGLAPRRAQCERVVEIGWGRWREALTPSLSQDGRGGRRFWGRERRSPHPSPFPVWGEGVGGRSGCLVGWFASAVGTLLGSETVVLGGALAVPSSRSPL